MNVESIREQKHILVANIRMLQEIISKESILSNVNTYAEQIIKSYKAAAAIEKIVHKLITIKRNVAGEYPDYIVIGDVSGFIYIGYNSENADGLFMQFEDEKTDHYLYVIENGLVIRQAINGSK